MNALRPWLQLVRLPAVFTAMADVCLGFGIVQGGFQPAWRFAALLVASSCLYLAGMLFNDVFDREVDAQERPQRPLPSGRVSLKSAVIVGSVLVLAGLAASAVAGVNSLLVAVGITAGVFAYDGLLKSTPLGPLAMGACRFLNVMLGASAAANVWAPPQVYVAGAMGIYIAGVTWFAAREAGQSRRVELLAAAVVVNLGLAAMVALVLRADSPDTTAGLFVLAVVLLTIDRRLANAWSTLDPERVQASVKTMLLSIVVLDAILLFVYSGNVTAAVATAALVVPAATLGRWIWVT